MGLSSRDRIAYSHQLLTSRLALSTASERAHINTPPGFRIQQLIDEKAKAQSEEQSEAVLCFIGRIIALRRISQYMVGIEISGALAVVIGLLGGGWIYW